MVMIIMSNGLIYLIIMGVTKEYGDLREASRRIGRTGKGKGKKSGRRKGKGIERGKGKKKTGREERQEENIRQQTDR